MKSRVFWWSGILLGAALVAGLPSYGRGGEGRPAAEKEQADLRSIRERASSMPVDARIDMDKRVKATVDKVNRQAREQGSSAVAARFAAEFSVEKDALLEEKGTLGWSWGDVMIAHTLVKGASVDVTARDLASLREDGLGWASIAYGLKFRMEDFEEAMKAQGRIGPVPD